MNMPLPFKDTPHRLFKKTFLQDVLADIDFEYDSGFSEVKNISSIGNGWDGYKAVAPATTVINNAEKFVKNLSYYNYRVPTSIEPTPYGTVVMNFENAKGLVSVEIGKSEIGWFTDFKDGSNHSSDGMSCDYSFIPQALEQLLV